MKYFLTILISTLTFINCFSQSDELKGKWVLVRTLYKNGDRLEINNGGYSLELIYTISQNSIRINGQEFEASFTDNQIKTPTRVFNYSLKENYLLESEENNDKISYFLKVEDLIKKFPEFALKESERDGEKIYIDNHLTGYEFVNKLNFEKFITTNMIISGGSYNDFQDLNFKVEFILTKENKLKDIKVLQSTDKDIENLYLNSLKLSERYFKNISGKDLLITKEIGWLRWPKKIAEENSKGVGFYGKKKFNLSIKSFEKLRDFIKHNQIFKNRGNEDMIRLGISYLAVGKTNEACEVFNEIGDITDFKVRNYLLDFCTRQ